jgi:dCMP deaminase
MSQLDNWDRYFLDIAKTVSTRGTCPRLQVGAVIVRDRNILCTGYNGSIRGSAHCTDKGCYMVENHCVRTVHAETNAILQAAKNGVDIKDAYCYVTHSPCINCLKHLLNAGISCIMWNQQYGKHPADILLDLGVSWFPKDNSISVFYKSW